MVDLRKFRHPNLLRGFVLQKEGVVILYDPGLDLTNEMVKLTLNRNGRQIDLLFDAAAIDQLLRLTEVV